MNTIRNNALGVVVSNGASVRIFGNTIQNSAGDGIQALRDSHADLARNQIFTNGGDGIEVAENATVQLREDSGASIFESANTTTSANTGFGIKCSNGGVTDGRQGSLAGANEPTNFAGSCIDSVTP